MRVAAVGVLTGWGPGVAALPADARRAAAGRQVIAVGRPALQGERYRRVTRECLLGIAAVEAALRDGGLGREAIGGSRTGLVYVTAAAYGASNQFFVGGGATDALTFPYTAPSAVPAEVAIEYGLTGAYLVLVGGPTATIDGFEQARTLLARGRADRVLLLAVETFEECAELHARGRWLLRGPLVEAAACAVLVPGGEPGSAGSGPASALERVVQERAGVTLACAPLIALGLARTAGPGRARLTGEWRGRRAGIEVEILTPAVSA